MHWIEDWLHVSPDGGSGAAEIAIWAGLIFLLVLAILVVLRRFGPPRVRAGIASVEAAARECTQRRAREAGARVGPADDDRAL